MFAQGGTKVSDLDKARSQATALIAKALRDKDFRSKLQSEPLKAMEEEGLEASVAEDIGKEVEIDGKPILTACKNTCWVSQVTIV